MKIVSAVPPALAVYWKASAMPAALESWLAPIVWTPNNVTGVGVLVGVFVGKGAFVGVGVLAGVFVGKGVFVGNGVLVGVGMSVGVGDGPGVAVGGADVGVLVGAAVGVAVGGTGVGVLVGAAVGVAVGGTGVGVLVGVAVGVLFSVNVAVTCLAAAIVSVTGLVVPVTAPLQPVKVELTSAVAVSVTTVLQPKLAVHVMPHAIPAGTLVTVPVPLPALLTVSV